MITKNQHFDLIYTTITTLYHGDNLITVYKTHQT
jgi:hypothetical protein